MSKSTKKLPKTKAKAADKPGTTSNEVPPKKSVIHNRLRPEKSQSDDPLRKQRQDLYYARQAHILAHKKQYRKDIKEGKRIPVPKTPTKEITKVPVEKKPDPKIPKKVKTEKERAEAKLKSRKKWYKNNTEEILKYQAKHRYEKIAKAKEEKKKKLLDEWQKLYGGE